MSSTTSPPATTTSPTRKHNLRNKQRDKRPTSLINDRSSAFEKRRNGVVKPTHKLSRPGIGTRSRIDEEPDEAEARLAKMCAAVRTLIECVGEDPDREGLLATPLRYAKALLFLTKGYQVDVDDVVNNALFYEGHSGMVIVKDIEIHSLCEHHLIPFAGKMQIGYMPSDALIGLSKLPRIAEMFSRRLQIQERLAREVAQAIAEAVTSKGVIVTVESSHMCMAMRGVQQTSATSVTSCTLGCFNTEAELRVQFYELLGVNKARL